MSCHVQSCPGHNPYAAWLGSRGLVGVIDAGLLESSHYGRRLGRLRGFLS